MSWTCAHWDGPVDNELQALISDTGRRPGARRTVPVHVRCAAGGHDSGARFYLELTAGGGLDLGSRGRGVFTAADDDIAEELSELEPNAQPPLRIECLDCGALGQGMAIYRVLDAVQLALMKWQAAGRQKDRPPRFVWPKT